MSHRFDRTQGLIIVRAQLWGPSGDAIVRLALDTGASSTVINAAVLRSVGYDPASAPERVRMTTGSGVEFVPRLPVQRLAALGCDKQDFGLVCHTLPPSASVDGLLGLDFMRGCRLIVDFRAGTLELG